ncbi:MAG TPA: septal ring lytic transglycosylase RlpA family protein [Polyangiaceae bacterium]|nr:septal ring lytic transglycosylase RlpA family protein [Polyangiaceae bacterium]
MTFGLDSARAPRPDRLWALRLAHWGGLALALADCRTPPPIARTPADPPAARALVPDDEPEPGSAGSESQRDAAREPETPADFSAEERELAARYARRRSQGVLRGEASYYGGSFAGRRTASGEVFEPGRFTAAHRTLPFGTVLRVTRTDTRAVVYVRVTDRGPYGKNGRILDLSTAAARQLGMLSRGVADVRADIVEHGVAPAKKRHGHGSR